MADTSLSNQIFLSRNEIKNQIIEYLQSYLELENVDLVKSSFLSFIIEVLAALTSNTLFYQVSTYKEFFLTKAQLPESILNLSSFLGYTANEATPATANVLITMPFNFTDSATEFVIPSGAVFKSSDIEFKTYYITTITVTDNSTVSISVQEGNKTYNFPVNIDTVEEEFSFVLPVRQVKADIQEFQIDSDLQTYQFYDQEVELDGQVSSLLVEVQEAGSTSWTTYISFNSLFLMDDNDLGYVSSRTDSGIRISFGNGLNGVQPPAGGRIRATTNLTKGVDGNVIAGSITTGDRIYNTTLSGITQLVSYTVVNTSAAVSGVDEESLESIRSNSIINLTALNRVISGTDFANIDSIIPASPLGLNSLPILKRSDLKVNEISLFTTLFFDGSIVPTKDVFQEFTSTYIPRQTEVTVDGENFYTIFDMTIDPLNTVADYDYILFELELIPSLTTTFDTDYDMQATKLVSKREGQKAIYELSYTSTEVDAATTTCDMEIVEIGATYPMTNDTTGTFVLEFANYIIVPAGELTYRFHISNSSGLVSTYSTQFTFRKSLRDFTMSDTVAQDSTGHIVYDIPVIKKSYYDGINQRDFELQVLQDLINNTTFEDYRMLTDFVSLKFGNTTGSMTNMQLNTTNKTIVSILSDPPSPGVVADIYIVGRGTGLWEGYDNYFATCTGVDTWTFSEPNPDQMVLVQSDNKKYIYSESGWVIPEYNIPLVIEVDVFKDSSYSGSLGDLTSAVRTAIYNEFSTRFGININIFRSEIIDVVQEVDGVERCRVVKPESSIFFDYDINDFTQTQLLEFSPEYIYFTLSNISVRVF
jgi:hypothetical protein